MAENQIKTTSNKTLDGIKKIYETNAKPPVPSGEAVILTKLARNLTESYQLVKQRQQKYNELSTVKSGDSTVKSGDKSKIEKQQIDDVDADSSEGEWHEVCSSKNKLKRKKKLSSSLTSVDDSVNQEKRTRIEGIQLNCRGKLLMQQSHPNETMVVLENHTQNSISNNSSTSKRVKIIGKPPLPPTSSISTGQQIKVPPPRLKQKLQENIVTIQKLNALTEQLRSEINEVKTSLISERGAVRVLRAQNESENRKWKSEVKKLQNTLDFCKKHHHTLPNTTKKNVENTVQGNAENILNTALTPSTDALAYHEIQRLTNEIIALKETNKVLEEKRSIYCDADRRKAADMRTLKDSYEIRLTQLSKSAKNEISRLLEEIKTKERSIGQLKKEIQIHQNKTQNENKSSNATNNTTNKQTTTNKSKNNNQNSKKPKKSNESLASTKENERRNSNQSQNSNQIRNLQDFEPMNNIKSQENKNNLKKTKLFTQLNQNNVSKPLETRNEAFQKTISTDKNFNKTQNTTCGNLQNEYQSMSEELAKRLFESKALASPTLQLSGATDYEKKSNNTDSDSALSSAPQSISPQPPPMAIDNADIWQTMRTYSTDIEKLQKDIGILQKENEHLHRELILAKEQLLQKENVSIRSTDDAKIKELLEKIKSLEEQEYKFQTETNELREQNELLEFRILELEETNDKCLLQSNNNQSTPSTVSNIQQNASLNVARNVWECGKSAVIDPMKALFGDNRNIDSGITSPFSETHQEEDSIMLGNINGLRNHVISMLDKSVLDENDKQCLQQILNIIQLDQPSQYSTLSLLTTTSNDEAFSSDVAKLNHFDQNSTLSYNHAHSIFDNIKSYRNPTKLTNNALVENFRIVATVPPYNSSINNQHQNNQHAPTNQPLDSPRKVQHSLNESGVFVEEFDCSDNLNFISGNHVYTQTDFEDTLSKSCTNCTQKLQSYDNIFNSNSIFAPTIKEATTFIEQNRLQYYKERLNLLENKVLIYESSGELQAKRLADRLQREIELAKQLKELQDRVEFLESENSTLEEEKCEFEEAENDTRLRLQRLEVDLEIITQRNIELEISREALSAKYKNCRSECIIFREDLAARELQIKNLEEDKKLAKENLEFLCNVIPLLLLYYSNIGIVSTQGNLKLQKQQQIQSAITIPEQKLNMGSEMSIDHQSNVSCCTDKSIVSCPEVEVMNLKRDLRNLKHKMQVLNDRHLNAMETADSNWAELERGYKEREEAAKINENLFKQKINKLQECLSLDTYAAHEKITQMEEYEHELKCSLNRIAKEHRTITNQYQVLLDENNFLKSCLEDQKVQHVPIIEAFEYEKKRCKNLCEELSYNQKIQKDCEMKYASQIETLQAQLLRLNREYLHIEVTNCELKEEVATLELQLEKLLKNEKMYQDKVHCLTDEVQTKEELLQKFEKNRECPCLYSGSSNLAAELNVSPSKRKMETVSDLAMAKEGLGVALKKMSRNSSNLPTHQHFSNIANNIRQLADQILDDRKMVEDDNECRCSGESDIDQALQMYKGNMADDDDDECLCPDDSDIDLVHQMLEEKGLRTRNPKPKESQI